MTSADATSATSSPARPQPSAEANPEPSPEAGAALDPGRGLYGISVAAELVGLDPQSLRLYERRGLLAPERTDGGTRRYSANDLDRLRRISELLTEGLNLAGIAVVLRLEQRNTLLERDNAQLEEDNTRLEEENARLENDRRADSPSAEDPDPRG